MMTAGWFQKIGWPIILTITLFSGCRGITSPVEFYTLTPLTATSEEKQTAPWREQIAVGVGPVEFPKIIDRPQIVTRTGQNKLTMDEFHRWGSTLQDEFLRVLTENLSILLKSDRVVAFARED